MEKVVAVDGFKIFEIEVMRRLHLYNLQNEKQ